MRADAQADTDLSLGETDKERLWVQEQAEIRAEMIAYAAEVAGTVDDLDPELEMIGLESLWNIDEI